MTLGRAARSRGLCLDTYRDTCYLTGLSRPRPLGSALGLIGIRSSLTVGSSRRFMFTRPILDSIFTNLTTESSKHSYSGLYTRKKIQLTSPWIRIRTTEVLNEDRHSRIKVKSQKWMLSGNKPVSSENKSRNSSR